MRTGETAPHTIFHACLYLQEQMQVIVPCCKEYDTSLHAAWRMSLTAEQLLADDAWEGSENGQMEVSSL